MPEHRGRRQQKLCYSNQQIIKVKIGGGGFREYGYGLDQGFRPYWVRRLWFSAGMLGSKAGVPMAQLFCHSEAAHPDPYSERSRTSDGSADADDERKG